MKEGNYNHLRLDNFTSLQQEFDGSKRQLKKNANFITSPSRTPLNAHNQSAILCSTPINELSKCGRKGFTPTSLDESYTLNSHNYVTPHGKDKSLRVPLSNISNKLGSGLDKQHQTNKKKSAPAIVSSYTPLKKQGESSGGPKSCLTKQSRVHKVPKKFNGNVAAFSSSRVFDEILDDDQCPRTDCQLGNKKQKIDPNLNVESSSNFVESILDVGECNSFILNNSSTSGLLSDGDDFFCDDDDVFVDNEITVDNVESNLNEITRACSADGYATLGPPTEYCRKCDAVMWKEDRVNKNVRRGIPKFSICCSQGQIKLPSTPPTPQYLMHLYTDKKKSNHFKRNIHGYHEEIPHIDPENQNKKKRKIITMKEYYSYKLQVRRNEGMTVRLGGRLFQHGIMYVKFKCTKHFPKEYCAQTTFDQSETEILEKVVHRNMNKRSQLEAFFLLNRTDPTARKYTFDEIPQHYVWNETDMIWHVRKRGQQIGRLLYTHHSAGELWYLCLLLCKRRNLHGERSININDQQLQFYVLAEIDKLLKSIGKSLKQFNQLPQPLPCYLQAGTNNLVLEETSYNVTEMEDEFEKLFKNLNAEQLQVYQHVL
ncbi:hypothetical protein POM88_051534 [Heracleum sosnowskyi]|uniref:Helitron helicase-like domain-containing protein n=1 Tax=Heracleum sosnowskyi TaxID=360622 RepID=A0AAD8M3T1_9APIA|nr:hypothetical protein POM88_051534 [Heracleum sosnowskyi]